MLEINSNEIIKRNPSYVNVLVLMSICFVLQCVGLMVPGWFVMYDKTTGTTLNMGLFFAVVCSSQGCDVESTHGIVLTRIVTITLVILGLLATAVAIRITFRLHRRPLMSKTNWTNYHLRIILSIGYSGALAMASCVLWDKNLNDMNIEQQAIIPPYGLILTGFGGLCSLAMCSILAEITYVQYNLRDSNHYCKTESTTDPRSLSSTQTNNGQVVHQDQAAGPSQQNSSSDALLQPSELDIQQPSTSTNPDYQ